MEIIFEYNGTPIISCTDFKNGMYELKGENGGTYIVLKEEIIDNL